MPEFDLAIVGAGSAGLSVASVSAQLGLKVALIERDRMGGDCLNRGCVPSKALLAAAHAAQAAREAGRLGVVLPEPVIEWSSVRARVEGAIAAIAPTDSEERYRSLGATVLRDTARFVAPDALSVGGRRITARRIVIAAGSVPAIPKISGLAGTPFLTSDTVFELPELPDHLLILGGGPLGLEMAQAFACLGVRITIITQGALARREDPELVGALRPVLERQGVRIVENAAIARVAPGPALILDGGETIAGSHLLAAVGRRPALANLQLDAGSVQASERGVATTAGLRSVSNHRVYAAGDIADPVGLGPRAFTHAASQHAGIVIRRAIFRLPARLSYAAFPRVTYTNPELAQAGLTEAEARQAGHDVSVVRWPLADNDRAIAEGDTTGLVKLVVAKGRVLGAGILAPHAGEMIGQWVLAIDRRTPLSALAAQVAPYPTRAEAAKRAASAYFTRRLFSARTSAAARLLLRLP